MFFKWKAGKQLHKRGCKSLPKIESYRYDYQTWGRSSQTYLSAWVIFLRSVVSRSTTNESRSLIEVQLENEYIMFCDHELETHHAFYLTRICRQF